MDSLAQAYHSCYWKKILKLRPLFHSMLKFKVGDGGKFLLWHDRWHPKDPLSQAYGVAVLERSGLQTNSKLSLVLLGITRRWPQARSIAQGEIQELLCEVTPTSRKDEIIWLPSSSGHFHFAYT